MDSPPTTIENQTPKEKPVVITSDGNKKSPFKYSFVNPKILGAMTVLLLLIGGVGTGVYLIQQPQQTVSQAALSPVSLNFQPSEIQITAGAEFSVDVFANGDNNQITGVDLSITFDPEILTLKSISPKGFLPKILVPPEIASGSASVSLGTEGSSGVTGSGVIASLLFETKPDSPPSTQISFDPTGTKIKVLNRSQESLNDILGNALVTIVPAPESEQTPSSSSEPDALLNSSDSATLQTSASSDFNNDGRTNSIDLSVMYSAWGKPETDVQKKADLNKDGTVNGMDYAAFLPEFKL